MTDQLQCEACGAQLQVEDRARTARCPYCAAPAVVHRPASAGRVDPTFVLGFVIPTEVALQRARRWVERAWFAPSAFLRAEVSNTRGVYVPVYLYTAAGHAEYSASIGENYTVVETYTTTDSKGRTVTRTRTRVKTEWRSLTGRWAAYVDDVVVTASRGIPNEELEGIEPFDLRALRRYSPKLLSGWIAEDPSIEPVKCRAMARDEAMGQIGKRLHAHMPGDKHTDLRFRATFEHEDLELLLVPVWVLAVPYRDDEPAVRLLINGQTGEIHGRAPKSWVKIGTLIVAVIVVLALVIWRASV